MNALPAQSVIAWSLFTALTCILLAIAIIDMREMRIPDVYNAGVLALGLLASALLHYQTVVWALLSTFVVLCGMAAVRATYARLRHTEGLGLGDVKFVAAAASWIGLEAVPPMILVAVMTALAWLAVAVMLGCKLTRTSRLPFGPFLALGLWVVWVTKVLWQPPFEN